MITILTNYGCGFGPFVRTFDLARRVRKSLEARLEEPVSIVVPTFSEQHRQLLVEEIGDDTKLINRVFMSPKLGKCLEPLLFGEQDFNQTLGAIARSYTAQEDQLASAILGKLQVTRMDGQSVWIDGHDMKLEVSRNPTIATPIEHAYHTSIGFYSGFLQAALRYKKYIGVDPKLVEKALPLIYRMESRFRLHFLPAIHSLSFENPKPLFSTQQSCPPLIPEPIQHDGISLGSGTYVSFSGIRHVRDVYRNVFEQAFALPTPVYSNLSYGSMPDRQIHHPSVISHPGIGQVIARAAWNTIWLANMTRTPLICPTFRPGDSPEIFFNTKTLQTLGLAHIWDPKTLSLDQFRKGVPFGKEKDINPIYERMKKRFGTLDGIEYCSKKIVEDYLNAS